LSNVCFNGPTSHWWYTGIAPLSPQPSGGGRVYWIVGFEAKGANLNGPRHHERFLIAFSALAREPVGF
jgi:hypothetical protein